MGYGFSGGVALKTVPVLLRAPLVGCLLMGYGFSGGIALKTVPALL